MWRWLQCRPGCWGGAGSSCGCWRPVPSRLVGLACPTGVAHRPGLAAPTPCACQGEGDGGRHELGRQGRGQASTAQHPLQPRQHSRDQQYDDQNGMQSQGYLGSQTVNFAVLGVQIAQVRRRVDPGAGHPLHQVLRLKLGPVAVDLLAQPAEQRRELAAGDLVGQVRDILLDALPQLDRDQVAQRSRSRNSRSARSTSGCLAAPPAHHWAA